MTRSIAAVVAALAVGACSGPTQRVVQGDLGPGPRTDPSGGFSLGCTYVPRSREGPPPDSVVAVCGATEPQKVRVSRVDGGLRIRLRFEDVPGRIFEVFVYRASDGFDRGARIVTRRRGEEPTFDEPESGWIAVQYYDRASRAIALQFSLQFPSLVMHGTFREGDVPLQAPRPAPRRADPWALEDAGPASPAPPAQPTPPARPAPPAQPPR